MKKINLKSKGVIMVIIVTLIMTLGYMLYLISKLIIALAYIMMSIKHSAKEELSGFFSIFYSIGDI